MNIIKESDFRKQIKTEPAHGYLFYGDEDYMKNFALSLAQKEICPDPTFAFFNEIKLDALSYSPDALLDAIMAAPLQADRKLVIVSGLELSSFKASELDALCTTVAHLEEYDYNTLIITVPAGKLDEGTARRPSAVLNKLSEHLVLVKFDKNTPAKLAAWVAKHFEHNGVTASPQVCALVIERCGRDMFNLSSETDKLAFYVLSQGRNEVTAKDVADIAIPVAEYDSYAFANAIGSRRTADALEILRDMKHRRVDPIIIMSEITRTMCEISTVAFLSADGMTLREISETTGIHEYKVGILMKSNPGVPMCKSILARCSEADIEIKTSRDGYSVIERLICTI